MNANSMFRECLVHQRKGDWSEVRLRQMKAAAFRQLGVELKRSGMPTSAADAFALANRELDRAQLISSPPQVTVAPRALASTGAGLAGVEVAPLDPTPALSRLAGATNRPDDGLGFSVALASRSSKRGA